jgi:hypothetical protein
MFGEGVWRVNDLSSPLTIDAGKGSKAERAALGSDARTLLLPQSH